MPWKGPIIDDRRAAAGHDGRPRDRRSHPPRRRTRCVGHIPVVEGVNAGVSYSVAPADGPRRRRGLGGRRDARRQEPRRRAAPRRARRSSTRPTPTPRRAAQPVIGTRSVDILRDLDPPHGVGDGQPGRRRDAREVPGGRAAITNSGGLRADIPSTPPSAGEQPGEITYGEVFAVLPFGNRRSIETLTCAQLVEALQNGFKPPCGDSRGGTGRTPQISGPAGPVPLQRHRAGDRLRSTRSARRGPKTPVGPADTVRFVTNDFMFTGGDGYTAFTAGHERPAARATCCSTWRSNTSTTTRRWRR